MAWSVWARQWLHGRPWVLWSWYPPIKFNRVVLHPGFWSRE